MYKERMDSVIAYHGAVDHVFMVYRFAGRYQVELDGVFYATAENMNEAYDIIEQAVDEDGWTFMEV